MLSLRKPSAEFIDEFLRQQQALDLSYLAVGATARQPPAGFVVDHTRIKLGSGEGVFKTAKSALENWRQFSPGWLSVISAPPPIQQGQVVAVLAHLYGLWWLNACRIVYVVDELGVIRRFGFAYGTLPGHAESGEERFMIEWDQSDNLVWYDILAFSRPKHLLTKLGYLWVRRLQKRFGRESAAAMSRAIASSSLSSIDTGSGQ